jgi:hypothetical protein
MISSVISVCAGKDRATWSVASDYIVANIAASHYLLIVPDNQIEDFRQCTNPNYNVVGEGDYVGDLGARILAEMPEECAARRGWYLQQFIKLSALERASEKASDEDLLLIWDADTVPLKKLNFVSPQGQILHYRADEHHRPYFDNLAKLLSLDKQVPYSFIAQCLAIKGAWVKEFLGYLEQQHNQPWQEAILQSIDFREMSGFSEYEALGSYMKAFHGDEICANPTPWQRYGNGMIGNVGNLKSKPLRFILKGYDYVSFERWDAPHQPGAKLLAKRVLSFLGALFRCKQANRFRGPD